MTTNGPSLNGWRTGPMYTFSEAGQLAHVSTSTVRNWVKGYNNAGLDVAPLITTYDKNRAMVSFLNLVEIVVAGQFRKALHVKYQTVLNAYSNAKQIFSLDYPFAHLKLEALGGHIVQRYRNQPSNTSMQSIDTPAQWPLGLPLPDEVSNTIHQLDYLEELAAKWFPMGRDVPIVIDPQISTGIPTVVGTGVTIGAIHERFKAGHNIEFLAGDYALEPNVVQTVIQYAMQHSELVAA